ncbi:UNVERIFIED_CONTAM: hypothetical protein FKN15_074667 [Acipenser sinensis]
MGFMSSDCPGHVSCEALILFLCCTEQSQLTGCKGKECFHPMDSLLNHRELHFIGCSHIMTAGVLQLRSSSTKMASDCMTMLYVMKIVPGTITMKKVVALEEEVALGIKEDSGVVLRLNRAVDEAEKEAVGLEEGEEDSSRIMETMILAALVGLEAEEEDLEVVQVMTVVKEEDEEDLAAEDLEEVIKEGMKKYFLQKKVERVHLG